jgi:hypothetical protein
LNSRVAFGLKLGLSPTSAHLLARLHTPEKIQDYIDAMPINHELGGETSLAIAGALHFNTSHCLEGALIAAGALWMQGHPPLLMNLQAKGDDDHAIALFRRGRLWGAISKSNHIWLRWRDPIYRDMRELAMSYFHEYVNGDKKTLRAYSRPFDLRKYAPSVWVASTESCWDLAWDLSQSRHYPLITPRQARVLRKRDDFEQDAGRLVQYPPPASSKVKRISRKTAN